MAPAGGTARRWRNEELRRFAGGHVDDLAGPETRLLFVGINPSLWSAAVNAHFARPGNRFWPALFAAGIVPRRVDASNGMSAADHEMVLGAGVGITNVVMAATARADELSREQLRSGAEALVERIEAIRPAVVAVLGLTAYRQAFGEATATAGRQATSIAGAQRWVLPNPSGLNAHETIASLAAAYRRAADAAVL